jgi:ATP-dependent Clp protease ATP-binding subunit ClpA
MFSEKILVDSRINAVMGGALEKSLGLVRPSDVVTSAIRADARARRVLERALRHGGSLERLMDAASIGGPASRGGPSLPMIRESFAPAALEALDEFTAVVESCEGAFDAVTLELMLHFVLSHFDDSERRVFAALDIDRALARLRRRVAKAVAPRLIGLKPHKQRRRPTKAGTSSNGQPFLLPPEIAPSEDLTHRAGTAVLPAILPFDGVPQYDRLFDAVTRALHRRWANHVLLVGERGVGKTTLVAELARRAAIGQIASLGRARFLSVDCRHIPVDESRQRLVALLNHVVGRAELVVCVDGLPCLLRSERPEGNKAVLLSALAHARCRFIGLLTPREYEGLVADDPDFAESFTRIEADEPDPETALKLLHHFAHGLEQQFGVAIDNEAVRHAVTLSANYVLNDQLPAKALKLLHRACEDLDYERRQRGSDRGRVTADNMVRAVSEASGVPEETLRGVAERSDYEQALREVVFGQDHAVQAVATELGLIKAGMTDPGKPASVLLFLGQTGTGKTELAKALARFYSTSKRLKTYTLGNCVEPHSVATVIGVPPGYVGHDQGGRLVNELNADPYCVFLLDEADKAHPDVLQPFLNLFDEGWVCDQRGVRASGDKAIFILTTNVGQRMIAEMVREGKSREEIAARMKEALSQIRHTKSERPVFTPEFLARIKRIIVFNSLDRSAMAEISRKLVAEMQENWAVKRCKRLEIPDSLVEYLAEQAHQVNEKSAGKEGGRVVRKLLADWVEARLQREITARSGEYRDCETVTLEFTPPTAPPVDGVPAAPEVSVRFLPRSA